MKQDIIKRINEGEWWDLLETLCEYSSFEEFCKYQEISEENTLEEWLEIEYGFEFEDGDEEIQTLIKNYFIHFTKGEIEVKNLSTEYIFELSSDIGYKFIKTFSGDDDSLILFLSNEDFHITD